MAITPGDYLPIANKTERTIEVFYLDAVMNMHLAGILEQDEAIDLMDRINAWIESRR